MKLKKKSILKINWWSWDLKMEIIEEDIIQLKRKKLKEQLEHPLDNPDSADYTRHEINWIEDANTWDDCKYKAKSFMATEQDRLAFVAHNKNICKGKPQLIHQTIQRIVLIKKTVKIIKEDKKENYLTEWKFIDDRFDKRYDGQIQDSLAMDFWFYRLIEDGKEYYLMSQEKLSEEYSQMFGMKIDLDDLTGISDTLKVGKIATLFLVKEFKSAVSVIPKDKLIEFTKEKAEQHGWNEQGFQDYVFEHPDGNIYDYTEDFNKLRIAQFLSGKYEGYPLHIMKLGPVGTGKTTEAEAIDHKFKEELGILEAGTSRMKVLVPSFKEKPANLGYICNCNRVAIIDELMKMVANAMQNQHVDANNYFGELNMLLEHKKRLVGSGNDNSTIVKTTAKICITSNPLKGKNKLAHHLSVLDNTTLSRMLIWVQDKAECDKIYGKEGIRMGCANLLDNSREHRANPEESFSKEHFFPFPSIGAWDCVLGKYHDFLTIYDSCQQFLVEFELDKVKELLKNTINMAKEPMKQVWKSRGLHHAVLVLDGITKNRCLFKDFDSSFVAKDEDYDLTENILLHMIRTWDSDLELNDFKGGW